MRARITRCIPGGGLSNSIIFLVRETEYLSSTRDGKASGTVDSDYLANKLSHRSIEIISILGEDSGIGLHLSDGAMVRFVLKSNHAEAVYYLPMKK
jgi:hypothetical protein